jgi:hypothetical protein
MAAKKRTEILDTVAERKHPWRFIAPANAKNLILPIDQDYQHQHEVIKGVGSGYLKFREGFYATTNPYVAGYLRWLIVGGKQRGKPCGITEDLSAFPTICTYAKSHGCDWSLPTSTKADQDALYDHIMTDHIELMNQDAELLNPIDLET